MVILGIHKGHDSSAAIVKNGEIIADVQEGRFSRIKHSGNAPLKAIEFCLKTAGIKDINEVDYISYSWEKTSSDVNAIFGLNGTESKKIKLAKQLAKSVLKMAPDTNGLKLPVYYPDYNLTDKTKFVTNNHHLAHAA